MRKTLKTLMTLCLFMAVFTASWAIIVQVGSGTATTNVLPIRATSNFSYSQQIYTKAQINKAGTITSISFYHANGNSGYRNSNDWDVYLGHTDKTSFTSNSDWVSVVNLTKVHSGEVNLTSSNGWFTVNFTPNSFDYNNIDNLVVAVDENASGRAGGEGQYRSFTSGANTGLYYNGGTNINPASPIDGIGRTGNLSQIQLNITPDYVNPLPTPRFVAEWEQADGAIISFVPTYNIFGNVNGGSFGLPNTLIKDLYDATGKLYVITPSDAKAYLNNNNLPPDIDSNNVVYIEAPLDTYWVRDYGPMTVFDGNNQMKIVDFTYDRPDRTDDNASTAVLASTLELERFEMNLKTSGGNTMTDGHGKAMSTNLVTTDNTGINVDQLFANYLGVTEYQKYADPITVGNNIDHIDLWAKLLDVDRVMVAQVSPGQTDRNALEDRANEWATKISSFGPGFPYKVFRVNCDGGAAYINSFILNKTIFVPLMPNATTANDAAIAAYEAAMPNYTVTGYYSNTWLGTDAIHCRVNTKYDEDLVFVRHIPVQNAIANATVSISAEITSTSSVDNNGTYISYRSYNAGVCTDWEYAPMSLVSGSTWSADIPTPAPGNTLFYTVRATDSQGNICNRRLNGQEDPFEIKLEERHYRSVETGSWDDATTWEYSDDPNSTTWTAATEAPNSGNSSSITVMDTHTVTLGSSVNADQLSVASGGTLVVPAGATLTIDDATGTDMAVNGNLTVTGALAFSTGATSTASQNSTIEFNGSTAQVAGSGFPDTVGNLIVNNPNGVTITNGTVVNGTLTQTSGAIAGTNDGVSNLDGYYSPTLNHIEFPANTNIVTGWSIAMTTPSLPPERVNRQWDICGAYSDTKTVTFYWDEADDGYFVWGNLVPAVYVGATKYTPSAYSVSGSPRSATVELPAAVATPACATYNIGRDDDGTLPVELSSFTVTLYAYNQVKIQWVTQSETNVSGFRIYRNSENLLETAQMLDLFIPATNSSQMKVYLATDNEINEAGIYYYWLENVDLNGESDFHGPIHIDVTFADAPSPGVPLVQGINNAYPNPFNPTVNIPCGMVKGGQATVQIYNTRGQLVKTLFSGTKEKGNFMLQWNGTDNYDRKQPSGVYLIRMDSDNGRSTRKVVLSQ